MSGVPIELTHEEWREAAVVGATRYVDATVLGRKPWYVIENPYMAVIIGACGERCVAKWLGVEWNRMAFETRGGGDVAGLEVRTTHHDRGHLLVYENDAPDRIYVLVVGTGPKWVLAGFMRGARAQVEKYRKAPSFKDGPKTFWVPQEALLRDFDALREWVLGRRASA